MTAWRLQIDAADLHSFLVDDLLQIIARDIAIEPEMIAAHMNVALRSDPDKRKSAVFLDESRPAGIAEADRRPVFGVRGHIEGIELLDNRVAATQHSRIAAAPGLAAAVADQRNPGADFCVAADGGR